MLARLLLQLALLSLSLAGCSTTDDALVRPEPAAGPAVPAVPAAPAAPLPHSTPLLDALLRMRSYHQLRRQQRPDLVFWAARGKRPSPVHYWDVGVPQAGMTAATIRRFLGLPSKRQQEWEARIDNGNGRYPEGQVDAAETGVDEEEASPAVSEGLSSERGKKEFWASRGKKGGGSDFWASRGKKDGGADFWASRGRRSGLAVPLDPSRVSALAALKASRETSRTSRGRWAE